MNSLFEFDKNLKRTDPSSLNFFLDNVDALIGCDEAGRGPAAGAVFCAAVCFLNPDEKLFEVLDLLNDSKKLSAKKREALYPLIKQNSVYSIQKINVDIIEKINILQSALLGMEIASKEVLSKIKAKNPLIAVDGNKRLKNSSAAQITVIKGDSKSASIAAASILAKVSRDNYMLQLDKEYPMYNWKKNKGYLTNDHADAIQTYGICEFHRKSFLKNFLSQKDETQISLFHKV